MDLTIIIVNFNTKNLLGGCLKSLTGQQLKYKGQVVVVDNDSVDGSVEMVEKNFPEVEVVRSGKNLGFAGGNNLGLRKFKSRYFLLLNSDTEVLPGSVDNLVGFMERKDFGISSCRLKSRDGSFQPNAGDLPFGPALFFWLAGWDDILPVVREYLPSFHRKFASYYNGEKEVGWVSGSVMMIKSKVVEKIGVLDEGIFMYGEDVEYCLRAKRAGFSVGWTDGAEIVHLGGGSSKNPSFVQWVGEYRGLLYIYKKYFGSIAEIILKVWMWVFMIVRMAAFFIVGKKAASQTYAKLLFSI